MAVDEPSRDAEFGSGVMAVPDTLLWAPGFVTDTMLVMVQVKVVPPPKPALSLTEMVTG